MMTMIMIVMILMTRIMMIMMMIMMMMIVVVVMMMIMMMIALKCAIRDVYNLLTAPLTVSSTYTQGAEEQSCENHVHHIERLSRATIYFSFTLLAETINR